MFLIDIFARHNPILFDYLGDFLHQWKVTFVANRTSGIKMVERDMSPFVGKKFLLNRERTGIRVLNIQVDRLQ